MEDDELQDQLDSDDDNDATDSGSDDSAPPTDNAAAPKDDGKRVNDLMSKWQRAEAEKNRLAARLAALEGQGGGSQDGDGDAGESRLSEFEEFARENARNTLFASDPRLAAAGLTAEDIAGSTLSEMKASMAKHQKLIGGIESRMRNEILAQHGLDPDVATGAGSAETPSFSKMSDKEFAEFLAARDTRPR